MGIFRTKSKPLETSKGTYEVYGVDKAKYLQNISHKLTETFKAKSDNELEQTISNYKGVCLHPCNYKDLEKIGETLSIANGAISKYVNYTINPGMYYQSDNPRAQQIIEDYARDINLQDITERWLKQGLIKGFSPIEIAHTKTASGRQGLPQLKVLSADNIYIQRDEKGKIKKYLQIFNKLNKGGLNFNIRKDNILEFKPEEILALHINQSDDEPYGLGLIYPNLSTLTYICNAELDMHTIMNRKANSPIHAQLGDKEKNIIPTSADITKFKASLEDLNNSTEWVTDAMVDMKVLDFGSIGDKFEYILDHDMRQFSTGINVPQVLLGYGNIAEGLATKQMEDFEKAINAIMNKIKNLYENQLFKKILEINGIDAKVELLYGAPSTSQKNTEITQITQLLSNQMLNQDLKLQLELRLAELMGLKTNNIPSAEQKQEDLMAQKQPAVPGQNTKLGQHTHKAMQFEEEFYRDENKIIEKYLSENPNITVKEWLGFNYQDFIHAILGIIEAYDFKDLKGFTIEDIQRGKFSDNQIEELREILKEGFEDGSSIKKISDNIKVRCKTKDLKIYNNAGKLVRVIPASIRNPMIARTEVSRMGSEGSIRNYKNNNIDEVVFSAMFDDRTSQFCQDHDGQIYSVHDASGILPAHPYCRSVWIPKVRLD